MGKISDMKFFLSKVNIVSEYKKKHPNVSQISMSKELGISPSSMNRICKYITSLDEII